MTEHVHEYPLCSELIAHVAEPWLLYIAALFHDIAKGRGGDHSILGEVDARTFCIEHELSPEQTDLVAFLVQHHLLMSSIAQKQDISDPDVIAHFAHRVKTQNRLTALYLLTVADIRGTSPKVWNAWKGKLLEDLYRNTLRYLGGESADRNLFLLKTQQEARQLLHWHTVDDKVIDATWQLLEVSYFVRHNSDEVAWHTRHIAERLHCPQPLVKVRHSRAEQSLDVLVFTPDESDLFARICGFFNSKNLNILDAKIHTTQHGYAIDSFVIQHHDGTEFDRSSLSLLENELTLGLEQKTALMEPHLGRISRQSKHFPVRPAVKLHADDKGNHFILSVSATDRTGLLYSIARVLAKRNINVHTAKIITLGGRAEDTFLISHNSLQSHKTQIELESELLLAIA